MPPVPDYLAQLNASLEPTDGGLRLLYRRENALFADIMPNVLRRVLNQAIATALNHFKQRAFQAHLVVQETQLLDLALAVAVDRLYPLNLYRQPGRGYANLVLRAENLDATDQILWFCEKEFGSAYAEYAAGLLGICLPEFKEREAARRQYYNK